MKRFCKVLMIAIVGTFVASAVRADIPDKYQTILERNPFGLNPPPPPTPETNAPPPVTVKVTGFATIGGVKRAYFTIPPKDPKEPQRYVGLSEGERDNNLEVLSIADQDGEVRVNNSGVEMVLSLKANGFKPATIAPGVAVAPNAPGGAPAPSSPVFNPAAASPVVANYNKPAPPPEPVPQQPAPPQPGVNPMAQPNAPTDGLRSIPVPTRTLRLTPQNNPPQSSTIHVDPVVQRVNMELGAVVDQQRGLFGRTLPTPPLPPMPE